MPLPDPTFPPLLAGHAVESPQTPAQTALAGLAEGRLGAGDVVWSRETDRCALAIILEPEVDSERAVEMLPLLMVALGDALGALVPSILPITFLWPGTLRADGARVGEVRMHVGPAGHSPAIPTFIVLDAWLALRRASGHEAGADLANTTLHDEGCGELDRTQLIESLARHFLSWLHRWSEDGFAPVHEAWLFRADHYRDALTLAHGGRQYSGTFAGLDEHGNLLMTTGDGMHRLSLIDSMAAARQHAQP